MAEQIAALVHLLLGPSTGTTHIINNGAVEWVGMTDVAGFENVFDLDDDLALEQAEDTHYKVGWCKQRP